MTRRYCILLIFLIMWEPFPSIARETGAAPVRPFSIEIDGNGTAIARCHDILLGSPELVFDVLTDYPHWSDLFPEKPVIHRISKEGDRTLVTMTIPGWFPSMNFDLVTATQEFPPSRIETQMVEGDFEQYEWAWTLTPFAEGTATQADLTVKVKPAIWTPGWILKWALESKLLEHLTILNAKVQLQVHPKHAPLLQSGTTP